MQQKQGQASTLMVVIAFLTVYVVWGSTYFFIKQALESFPPFILGAVRFIIAGLIMLAWCVARGEKVFDGSIIRHAAVGGFLMLFIGNGTVIWVEQTIPSALAAIMVSSAPLWFVILDKPKWSFNFRDPKIITGLVMGFFGVMLLFSEHLFNSLPTIQGQHEVIGMALLSCSVVSWAIGSLYVKYKMSRTASTTVNTLWQMLFAGVAFIPGIFILDEQLHFRWHQVSQSGWMALSFLILMGSLAAYSAYLWLLKVRPATQVSTNAYVNPVVAVLLGVLFGGEKITLIPVIGLAVILVSVLLINLVKMKGE